MKIKTKEWFAGLDGLRAIACLMIIFFHMALKLDIYAQHFIVQHIQLVFLKGMIGVSIFFVLSGFLLSYPFWNNYLSQEQFPDIKNYAIRRTARIVPGYYAALITGVLLAALYFPEVPYFGRRLLTGLTFTSGFHYTTFFPSTISSPLWSISYEVFSYLLMPVCMLGLFKIAGNRPSLKKGLVYWLFVLAFMLVLNQLIHIFLTPDNVKKGWEYGIIGGAKYWMPKYNPIGFFCHFIFGIVSAGICANLAKNTTLKDKLSKRGLFDKTAILCAFLIIIFIYIMIAYDGLESEFIVNFQQQPYHFPYLTFLIALMLISLINSRYAGKILDNRFMRFTAKISFGLYIWHYIVMFILGLYLLPEYVYKNMGVSDWREWLGLSVLILIVSYGVATASYYWLELPGMQKIRNYFSGKVCKVKRKITYRGVVSTLLLLLLAILFIFPLFWLLDASFRPPLEALQSPPVIFQKPISEAFNTYTRNSYIIGFNEYNIGSALFNSIVVTTGTITLTGIVSSLYAYAIVFIQFKHKQKFFVLAVSTMMIPTIALIIPFYQVVKSLHLVNSWFGLILPGAISGFGVFLLRQYFLKIPYSIIEAAHIDGANHFRIWWHIILPLLRPALAALAIIQFRIVWNDYLNPAMVLRDNDMMTLPVRILQIYHSGATLAAGVISIIVPLLLFLKFHKQFTGELMSGYHR